MKKVLVLGATGSIGTNTLDIARKMPESFSICGLSAHSNSKKLKELCEEFNCKGVLTSFDSKDCIKQLIEQTAPDIVVNGIAGSAGLLPSKTVIEHGIDLALANKETVVMAWSLIKDLAKKSGSKIIPVDSEHSAVFNLINQAGNKNVDSIIITASGGPFREYNKKDLEKVTVKDALKHPTWNMGKKITIDSATLANKGLEVIEACRLFDRPVQKVKVVVHPQSLIHSLIRTNDGMLYAQISDPTMKHPIFSALTYPENKKSPLEPFELFDQTMTFYKPRFEDFPMLKYAYEAAENEKSYTIVYNAANEVAVSAFLEERITFTKIPLIVKKVLDKDWTSEIKSFDDVFEQDLKARNYAQEEL